MEVREVNEEPVMAELLGGVDGLSVLDVGCGTGRHTLKLARSGARATGMDFSEGMLSRARMKAQAYAAGERSIHPQTASFKLPRFLAHDVSKPFPFAEESFDRVISALIFNHVAAIDSVFAEMKRVCKRDGFVIVTGMHPAVRVAPSRAGLRIVEMLERAVTPELAALGWPLLLAMKLARE